VRCFSKLPAALFCSYRVALFFPLLPLYSRNSLSATAFKTSLFRSIIFLCPFLSLALFFFRFGRRFFSLFSLSPLCCRLTTSGVFSCTSTRLLFWQIPEPGTSPSITPLFIFLVQFFFVHGFRKEARVCFAVFLELPLRRYFAPPKHASLRTQKGLVSLTLFLLFSPLLALPSFA